VHGLPTLNFACAGLSQASTSFLRHLSKQAVDGRDNPLCPGHDSE
jgi:hypothetical protein